ncbi:zinc finger, CCHC-type containing protein [Tanacetum coccineum]
MDEAIQVSCIIDKLPPSWKDFKHTLKHKKEELTMVELGSHLRNEDSLKVQDNNKPKGSNVASPYYLCNQMFRLNIVNNIGKSAFMSTFKLNDSIIWYVRLGNVHFNSNMQDMSKDGLIPAFDMNTRKWNKKYFVTFIDDASRFCYVSLLHTKDEALDKLRVIKTEVKLHQRSLIKRFRIDRGGLSQGLWDEAMLIVCYLLNRVPNKRNGITPYELWTKRKPKLNYLRVWGCRAVVRLPDPKLKTLGERGIECIFVGYAEHSKDFRIPNGTKDIGDSVVPKEVTEEVVQQPEPELRKSKRNRTPKDFGPEFQLYLIEGTRDEDVTFWKEAINDEMDSIIGNNTWVLTDLPLGCKPLGCKWIFKRKPKVDRTIEKFKARLVIQGFKQKSGIDYFDTYVTVARISTIRLLIAMASIHNLIIHQMDVKTTFLNGDLDVEANLTKEFLSSKFSMKDMGEADVIHGIRIKHESNGIAISQSHYIEKAVSQLKYSRVIGCLMYAMTCTRHDIAFAVGKLSRYTSNPSTQHWQAIQRVLKYLKKTIDYRLTYTGYPSVLEGYTDASDPQKLKQFVYKVLDILLGVVQLLASRNNLHHWSTFRNQILGFSSCLVRKLHGEKICSLNSL